MKRNFKVTIYNNSELVCIRYIRSKNSSRAVASVLSNHYKGEMTQVNVCKVTLEADVKFYREE